MKKDEKSHSWCDILTIDQILKLFEKKICSLVDQNINEYLKKIKELLCLFKTSFVQ